MTVGVSEIAISGPGITTVELSVDKGSQGQRGTMIFSGFGHPSALTSGTDPDFFIYTTVPLEPDDYYFEKASNSIYQFCDNPGTGYGWKEMTTGEYELMADSNIDFAKSYYKLKSVTATTTFTYSNKADGHAAYLIITNSSGSARTLAWSGTYTWTTAIPTSIANGETYSVYFAVMNNKVYAEWRGTQMPDPITFADGREDVPSLSNTGDTDTGIYWPAANTLAVSTNGIERLRINSTGVGIGVDPSALLHLSAASPALKFTDTDTGADHRINADSSVGALVIDVDYNAEGTTPRLLFQIAGSEKMRLDANGYLGIGTNSPGGPLHIQSDTAAVIRNYQFSTDAAGPAIYLGKHRGTAASATVNAADDQLGTINFYGYTGTTRQAGASIAAYVEDVPSSDMPGRLVFSTTADGATTTSERMRIDSSGNVVIGRGEGTTSGTAGTLRAARTAGTNIAGTDLNIMGGAGTGSGAGGSVKFYTAPAGSTGTTQGTDMLRLIIDSAGLATFANNVRINGNVGFYNTAPVAKPTVTGSRGGNAALASLITALANLGLITDSTS